MGRVPPPTESSPASMCTDVCSHRRKSTTTPASSGAPSARCSAHSQSRPLPGTFFALTMRPSSLASKMTKAPSQRQRRRCLRPRGCGVHAGLSRYLVCPTEEPPSLTHQRSRPRVPLVHFVLGRLMLLAPGPLLLADCLRLRADLSHRAHRESTMDADGCALRLLVTRTVDLLRTQ